MGFGFGLVFTYRVPCLVRYHDAIGLGLGIDYTSTSTSAAVALGDGSWDME